MCVKIVRLSSIFKKVQMCVTFLASIFLLGVKDKLMTSWYFRASE